MYGLVPGKGLLALCRCRTASPHRSRRATFPVDEVFSRTPRGAAVATTQPPDPAPRARHAAQAQMEDAVRLQ